MAIVITNGEHYIHINEHGKYVKFNNLLNATQFASAYEAISRIKKAPALFEERIREIYMYQMEKKYKYNIFWKIIRGIIRKMVAKETAVAK